MDLTIVHFQCCNGLCKWLNLWIYYPLQNFVIESFESHDVVEGESFFTWVNLGFSYLFSCCLYCHLVLSALTCTISSLYGNNRKKRFWNINTINCRRVLVRRHFTWPVSRVMITVLCCWCMMRVPRCMPFYTQDAFCGN